MSVSVERHVERQREREREERIVRDWLRVKNEWEMQESTQIKPKSRNLDVLNWTSAERLFG